MGVEPTRPYGQSVFKTGAATSRLASPCVLRGAPGRVRTCDIPIKSRELYRLSYRGMVDRDRVELSQPWRLVYSEVGSPIPSLSVVWWCPVVNGRRVLRPC